MVKFSVGTNHCHTYIYITSWNHVMAGQTAAPPLKAHMHLEGLESKHYALNYSRTAHVRMWFANVI